MKTFNYIISLIVLVLAGVAFAQPVVEREIKINMEEVRRESNIKTKAFLLKRANEYEQKAIDTRAAANSISISAQ